MSDSKKYPEILFRGKSEKEKQQIVAELENSSVLSEVAKVVKAWKAEVDSSKSSDYDSPSWGYLQADRNGMSRAYENILKLINPRV